MYDAPPKPAYRLAVEAALRKLAQVKAMGLAEVLGFSRHRDVKVLMVHRERERNVQGQLATLAAAGVEGARERSLARRRDRNLTVTSKTLPLIDKQVSDQRR